MLQDEDAFVDESGKDLNDVKSQEYASEEKDISDVHKTKGNVDLETQNESEENKAENSDAYYGYIEEDDLMQLHLNEEKRNLLLIFNQILWMIIIFWQKL